MTMTRRLRRKELLQSHSDPSVPAERCVPWLVRATVSARHWRPFHRDTEGNRGRGIVSRIRQRVDRETKARDTSAIIPPVDVNAP